MKRNFWFIFLVFGLINATSAQNLSYSERILEFYENQQYAEAAKLIEQNYPDHKPFNILSQLGSLKMLSSDLLSAEHYYLQAMEISPDHPSVLLNLARIKNRRGLTKEARIYYESYVNIDSTSAAAFRALAYLIPPSDTLNLKIKYFAKANQINPTDAEIAMELADLYLANREYQQGLNIINKALEADSTHLYLQASKLKTAYQLELMDEAIKAGTILIENEFFMSYYMNILANIYFNKEDYKSALNVLNKIAEDDKTEYSYSLITRVQMALQNYREAMIAVNRALEKAISEGTADYYRIKGIISENIGDSKGALEAYNKGLQFDQFENHASNHYYIALLNDYKLKNKATAISNYKSFIEKIKDLEKFKNQLDFAKNRLSVLSK